MVERHCNEEELEAHWLLTDEERALMAGRTGHGRLGFAVMLKFHQCHGRFPVALHELPADALRYLSEQIGTSPQDLSHYDWEGRTTKRQRSEILSFLGIRRITAGDRRALLTWMRAEVLPLGPSVEQLLKWVGDWLRERRIEPPGVTRLDRLIRSELHAFEQALLARIADQLSEKTRSAIDLLLAVGNDEQPDTPPAGEAISFVHLRMDPGRTGLDSVFQELGKLTRIRQMELPAQALSAVPAKWSQKFCLRTGAVTLWDLRRHPSAVRYALVAVFCWHRQQTILDGVTDLLIQIVHKIATKAENRVEQELLEDFRRVRGKDRVLFQLAEAAVGQPDGVIKDVLYPVVGLETLNDLVKEFKANGPAFHRVLHTVIRASYSNHYRRMLPHLLEALEFRSNNAAHRPVIEALDLLKRHCGSRQQYFTAADQMPLDGVIRPKWRDIVVERDKNGQERVNRINYEICVLQALRDRLRSKEIWVVGADRYRNPDDDLPSDFETRRGDYYEALGLPQDPGTFISALQKAMVEGLGTLNRGMPKNSSVRVRTKGEKRIVVTPLDAQPGPPNLHHLKAEIFTRWSSTSLLDVLKEADLRVGFSEAFHSIAGREVLDRTTLQRRLLLCLYGLGTNTGLKRVATAEQGVSYKELLYVRQRFITKTALRDAIAQVVNATFAIRQPAIWGEGSTTCASDSKKFGAWDQNLMTEWHIRYGGRGVMIYWHVENQSVCIYSQLKRCSSSEVASMIEGVLHHKTDMEVQKTYTDSHGQSEVGFAFCHMLGFELLPRLKAIASQKLYLPEAGSAAAHGHLEPILTRPINWDLIRQQYDEMIKYATALRLGTAGAEAILRRFTRGNLQHPTYRALAELGKAVKTIFLCRYLHSEALRREIHEGLNVVENWNSANSFIFYGKGGEVSSNRHEDQEMSVLALHLLQLSLVYVNTLMIQRVLSEPIWRQRMQAGDYRALSPLIYSHVNPYGRFELDMNKRLSIEEVAAA
jgi:TnpA family transposase